MNTTSDTPVVADDEAPATPRMTEWDEAAAEFPTWDEAAAEFPTWGDLESPVEEEPRYV
jgi:hypothetical protein